MNGFSPDRVPAGFYSGDDASLLRQYRFWISAGLWFDAPVAL